ncbi:Uncharacterised protein [Bordetella trematum]|uniref:Uncharacterized protein n=1 Tax=Bordetella trematum TaxID=123899 RepID=A0A157SND0_9BORD|nr:hypothetical protein [Bordetella trematum]NNH17429.1 hypothetical protein [Bordetella trematum]SAI59878.1 Uncharacterised protein [Bordetella trematum]SAI71663.1 Uncharacterised protein [Bordetella trematum]SUV98158.1 Uncharacterised protein [Bordetella trematum]
MNDSFKQDWQSWVALVCATNGLAATPAMQAAIARTLLRLAVVQSEIPVAEHQHD